MTGPARAEHVSGSSDPLTTKHSRPAARYTESLLDGDAGRLSLREYHGSGPDVLMIHGAGRNLADLDPIATELSADHRVVTMDLRAHGRSDSAPWTLDAVIADIERVVSATALVRPAIVGHSLGGMLGALYDARGGTTTAVVNLDGYGRRNTDQYIGLTPEEVAGYQRRMLELRTSMERPDASGPVGPAGVGRMLDIRLSMAHRFGVPTGLEVDAFARSLHDVPGGTVRWPDPVRSQEMGTALDSVDWFEIFAQVRAPFLLYQCTENIEPTDDLAPFLAAYNLGLQRSLEDLAKLRPNVTVRALPTHHAFLLTMPRELAAQARAFLVSGRADNARNRHEP